MLTTEFTSYSDQIERIKLKLPEAKKADKEFRVFGASKHEYQVSKPASREEVEDFEKQYSIELPGCYRNFILSIGNGGKSYKDSAAGPFYGIYPLGSNTDDLLASSAEQYLKEDCVLFPGMTDEFWKTLTKKINEDENIEDDEYDRERGKIFSGILPIGSQGCSYFHGIVLNGPYRGRIINLDQDMQKPQFTFEKNFLDWYERWLDEVISGDLVADKPTWFGYSMGGSDKDILNLYLSTEEKKIKDDCLQGLLNKQKIGNEVITKIKEAYAEYTDDQNKLLEILVKFDYERSRLYLINLLAVDLTTAVKFIYGHAKNKSSDWAKVIEEKITGVEDHDTFRYCTYLLRESRRDYGNTIVPFTESGNEEIKVTAFYTLGLLENKTKYLDTFIKGLHDNSNRVVHITLQALSGVKDRRLLEHYRKIAEKYIVDEHAILTNLDHRLAEFNHTRASIKA